jgi:hypothetical protein
MTEPTTEEQIAKLAKDRAKTILENGDFWSSPGAANTSATAVTALVELVKQVSPLSRSPKVDAEALSEVASEAFAKTIGKSQRATKPKDQTLTPKANAESESADA